MASQAEVGNLRVRLGIDSAEFANGVRAVQGSLASLGNSLKAFATGTAAITLFSKAVEALHQVADIGDVAESIGLTAEQLQVYNRMALASGTTSDIMARGLQSIAEQSTDAQSKLSQLFAANGLITSGKEMNQIIQEFMTLLQNAKSPAEQLAMATGVLGDKVGRQLVESLRSGASGWNDAFNTMVQSGAYLTNQQVAKAQELETKYNEVIANIQARWQGMVVRLAQGLASFKVEYQQGAGGGRSAVPAHAPYGGKSTVNMGPMGGAGQFQFPPLEDKSKETTVNPFNGITLPKPSKPTPFIPQIPPGTIDDIYGAGKAVTTLRDDMADAVLPADELTNSLQNMADTIASTLGDAITGLISGTMSLKEAFSSVAQSISQQLAQLASQLIKSSIFKLLSIMAGGFGGGGVGFNFGGMSFGGLYADGGHLGSGKWGIAGEAGPEIIHGPANITPMGKMGGGDAPQVNVQIINNSSAQVRASRDMDGSLKVFVEEVVSDLALRGGNKLDAALSRGYGLRRAGR